MHVLMFLLLSALPVRAQTPSDTAAVYADSLFLGLSPFKGLTYAFYPDEPGKAVTSPFRLGYYTYPFTEEFTPYTGEERLMRQAENVSVFNIQALLIPAVSLGLLAFANDRTGSSLWREDVNNRLYVIAAVLGGATIPAVVSSAVILHRAVRERNGHVVQKQ